MAKGKIIVVGGGEGKTGDEIILETIAAKATRGGHLVTMIIATEEPESSAEGYREVFKQLGVKKYVPVIIERRDDAFDKAIVNKLDGASVVFIAGGDQLQMTSLLGNSDVIHCMEALYKNGTTLAGSSARASVMSDTMIISGNGDDSESISALGIAPGFGFIHNLVIDSHFAERGRISRLLGAVAQNPDNMGIGLDEDTALVIGPNQIFSVIGSGAAYVIDGTDITYTSLSQQRPQGIVTIHGLSLHVLGAGDKFDLKNRRGIVTDVHEN